MERKHRPGSKLRMIHVRISQDISDLLKALAENEPTTSITEAVEEGIRLVAKKRLKKA